MYESYFLYLPHNIKSMSTTDTKILVVDDEETLCEVVQLNLENEGYTVDMANCAEQALEMDLAQYSLILLDIMMGEISGIKMAKMLKNDPKTANIPIIFCSAKDTDDDVVLGLNLGADDYITKPYTIRQLIARVKSVLRRTTATTQTPTLSFEGLALDVEFKQCIIDGNEVKLPRKEYELLLLFLSHKGRIFSREEILQKVWPDEVVVLDRTIDVNITRLRQKLGEYGKYIVTRSGYGYGFKA